MPHGSKLFKYAFELVELVHNVDEAWMHIKKQFLRLVEVGIENGSSLFGPAWRKRKAVHDASQPIELNAIFFNIEEEYVFEDILRCAL